MKKVMHKVLWVLTCTVSGLSGAETGYEGVWIGTAHTSAESTRISLTIQATEDGYDTSMNLLDIGVLGWPALETRLESRKLVIAFPSDSGAQTMTLVCKNDSMSGTWAESRFDSDAKVTLKRQAQVKAQLEKRVLIEGPAGALGASVMVPEGSGPFQGVVFLHGSGPQPRDSSRFAARALLKLGLASVIYDKRGVGESEGSWKGATFEALAQDGMAVAKHLAGLDQVQEVGFFGHSQGGWIAPLAATLWDDTAFVITSAGPAVPPSREGQWDVVRRLREANVDPSAEHRAREFITLWHDAVRNGSWETFEATVAEVRREDWFEKANFSIFLGRPSPDFIKSYRVFMDYDPVPILKALKVPMLAIFAPMDESIDSAESMTILEGLAAQGMDVRIVSYPGYDHSMRRIGDGSTPLRFAGHPRDYFAMQAAFVKCQTSALR